jgi:hypothetical protein
MKKQMIVLNEGKNVKQVAADGNCCSGTPSATK